MESTQALVRQANRSNEVKCLPAVSCLCESMGGCDTKGIGAHLMKSGTKRRRTQAEMQESRAEEFKEGADSPRSSKRISELEKELHETKAKATNNEAAA